MNSFFYYRKLRNWSEKIPIFTTIDGVKHNEKGGEN